MSEGFLNVSNGYLNSMFFSDYRNNILVIVPNSFSFQGLCCSFLLEHPYPRLHLGAAVLFLGGSLL